MPAPIAPTVPSRRRRSSATIEPEPLQALLDRAHDAVVAVVEHGPFRRRALVEAVGPRIVAPGAAQQAADLGRQHERSPGLAAQEAAEPLLGEAEPVERCGVEVADAEIPGARDGRLGVGIADRREQPAERRGAEAKPRDLERRWAELSARDVHGRLARRYRRPAGRSAATRRAIELSTAVWNGAPVATNPPDTRLSRSRS
jgi:hypothetical protein